MTMTEAQIADLVGRLTELWSWYAEGCPFLGGACVIQPDFAAAAARDLREAIAALDGWQQERAWEPIATAPQDGTSFLAVAPASSVFFAHWANGVVDGCSWTDVGGYEGRHATHWMPLPTPPTEGGHS